MRSCTFGTTMPAHLKRAAFVNVVGAVDLLQEVLRYCAPDRAEHGWARMCMYRASDAMDTLGRFAGVIAAQLAENGMSQQGILRLLHVEKECSRTDRPRRLDGVSHSKRDLFYMPSRLHEEVQNLVAQVVLRLHQVVKESRREDNPKWFRRCLYQLALAMDELGMINRAIAAVNAGILSQDTLARYQHLFQQRSRLNMPDVDDRMYLAGLMGHRIDGDRTTWNAIGLTQGENRRFLPSGTSHDGRVLQTLAALDSVLQPLRWKDSAGRQLDRTRCTAMAYLNALTAVESDDDDYPPLHWLDLHSQVKAAVAANAIFGIDWSRGRQLTKAKAVAGRGVADEG
ncbi:hypothetical protein ACWCYK_21935 [Streptomyces lydicamycinicus]